MMSKRFNFGVCEWSMQARGRDLCAAASAAGLGCLQLGVGEEVLFGRGLGDPALAEAYREASEDFGLEIVSLAPQFVDAYSYTMAKGAEEERIVWELTERTLDCAVRFGCASWLLPVLEKNGIEDGTSFHRAVRYVRYFADKAASEGITTCLEVNLSPAKFLDLLDAVDNEKVRLFFDSQNLYAHDGTSMARYFYELEDVIGGVHVKDGVDALLSGSLLGEGTSGFYRTAEAICKSSYTGPVIIESVYTKASLQERGSEEELLALDAATLRRAFSA